MKYLNPINRKAKRLDGHGLTDRVVGMACSDCGTRFDPGWETGACGNIDPCPWLSDLPACYYAACWWSGGSVPGVLQYPGWLNCCDNFANDWTCFCVVPD